jgi:hypothetical protein
MIYIKEKWMENFIKILFIILIVASIVSIFGQVIALPSGPTLNYLSNTSAPTISTNRSQDIKGTITTITLNLAQQDYKWKAYVGNVTGSLSLDNANSKSIYDWALTSITGEVYVSRASTVNWNNISCVNQTVINSEQTALGIASNIPDSINATFNNSKHKNFVVATANITNSTCRAIATYLNDTAQTVNETALFQEILLKDDITNSMVYTSIIEPTKPLGYDGLNNYNFQLLVAENESATIPTTYYFYVELG